MAKFDFDVLEEKEETRSSLQSGGKPYVSFFALKHNGDTALVRFPYKSDKEFDLLTVHTVKVGTAYRNINCLGTEGNCPLCEAGDHAKLQFFCKMIGYENDENGKVVIKPYLWQRPYLIAKKIKSYMQEYGDISEMLFKIKRNGNPGDMNTTYDILPANMAIYKPEIYIKDFSGFDSFDLYAYSVLNLSKEKMLQAYETGSLDNDVSKEESKPVTATTNYHPMESVSVEKPVTTAPKEVHYETNKEAAPQTQTQSEPASADNPTTSRPRRYTY